MASAARPPATCTSSRAWSRRRSTSGAATTRRRRTGLFPTAALAAASRRRRLRPRVAEDPGRDRGRQAAPIKGCGAPRLKGAARATLARAHRVPKDLGSASCSNSSGRRFDRRRPPGYDQHCRGARRHASADAAHLRAEGARHPQRTAGNTRLYSDVDVERLQLIQRLTTELGLNPRASSACSTWRTSVAQRRLERMERRCARRSTRCTFLYRRDLVVYQPPQTPAVKRRAT